MSDPVLVEVLRGGAVESVHRGTIAVHDADGKAVLTLGDARRRIFPRSAVKVIQAIPLITSGAADRFKLTDEQLALACASHGGEDAHAATASAMLAAAGRDESALECGCHWPMHVPSAYALAGRGQQPSALHNNCSGKHAGFVCLACATGHDPKGYVGRSHAVQRMVDDALMAVTGEWLDAETPCGTDGCSIPTYALPLDSVARGFARMGAGRLADSAQNAAVARLAKAVAMAPFMVAGTGRFCTRVMELLGARVFVKTGAEGVFCAFFPEQGLGVALKASCGTTRAAEIMMAAMIKRFVPMNETEKAAFQAMLTPTLTNWNGINVGSLRPAGAIA